MTRSQPRTSWTTLATAARASLHPCALRRSHIDSRVAWEDLPVFCVLLTIDARPIDDDALKHLSALMLQHGFVYFCAWGSDCERVHDCFDSQRLEPETDANVNHDDLAHERHNRRCGALFRLGYYARRGLRRKMRMDCFISTRCLVELSIKT